MDVPWRAVHAYQVDERVAPDGDPDRNADQLAVLPVRSRNGAPDAGDSAQPARRRAGGTAPVLPERFDVVHLGIGDDGHTASWPPGDPVDRAPPSPWRISGEFNGQRADDADPAGRQRGAGPAGRGDRRVEGRRRCATG